MPPDRDRTSAATAAVGAALVGAGGQARHAGVRRAVRASGKGYPRVHPTAFLRNKPGRVLYGAGNLAGAVGATGLGVGLYGLAHKPSMPEVKVGKPAEFVREGVKGNVDAARAKAKNSSARIPLRDRATAIAASAGAGWAGGRATSRLVRGSRLAPALAAIGGTTAGVASLPVTNRLVARRGYEVTPTGVKRKKTPPVRPTRDARVVETRTGRGSVATPNARAELVPSDRRFAKYYGENMSPREKRIRVMTANATPGPLIGPLAGATMAARLAPPEQQRSAAALQFGGFYGGGALGALGGSQLAARAAKDPAIAARLDRVHAKTTSVRTKIAAKTPKQVRRLVEPSTSPGRVAQAVGRMAERPGRLGRLVKPLAEHPVYAAMGAVGGKAAGALAGQVSGYGYALHREKKLKQQKAAMAKAQTVRPMTYREQKEQLKRKKRALGLSTVGATVGATGFGTFAGSELGPHLPGKVGEAATRNVERMRSAGLKTALVGGGISAYQGFNNARISRRDLNNAEAELERQHKEGVLKAMGAPRVAGMRRSTIAVRRHAGGVLLPFRRANAVAKIDTTLTPDEAKRQTDRYGLRGPLPRTLSRPERMHAYEGRYIMAGGPKGEKWDRRAKTADAVTATSLGAGGIGAGSQLYHEVRARGMKAVAPSSPKIKIAEQRATRSGRLALAAGTVGAGSELAHRYAQHRSASYRHSPAGVAASALRRMRDYTPED